MKITLMKKNNYKDCFGKRINIEEEITGIILNKQLINNNSYKEF